MITFSRLGNYGRLGNQMFQIASTIGIAEINDQEFCFPEWEYQNHFKNRLPRFVDKDYQRLDYEGSDFKDFRLVKYNYDLSGYFQSWKYFKDSNNTVKKYFTPKEQPQSAFRDAVAVHVRRGDYLGLQHIHPTLGMNYYDNAMSYFPGKEFLVFSDDIDWCVKNFTKRDVSFVESNDNPVLDLLFMSQCSRFIIANSSFSWWGAYLSGSKTVVAPKIWALNETKNERLMPDWLVLNNED